jgi:hypothetical protein
MTTRNKYSLIAVTALLVSFAVIFFSREKKVFLHAEAVKTAYGWGYNVLAGERIYIKQEFIPGIPGKQGFTSADDALRVGNLVIKRISGGLQPTISTRDLDSLGIIKNK